MVTAFSLVNILVAVTVLAVIVALVVIAAWSVRRRRAQKGRSGDTSGPPAA